MRRMVALSELNLLYLEIEELDLQSYTDRHPTIGQDNRRSAR